MKFKRIQRKRTKGWRMPPNTVYVGRPSIWGNHFIVGVDGNAEECFDKFKRGAYGSFSTLGRKMAREELKGKNLACWCALDQPCHADILLEIANKD